MFSFLFKISDLQFIFCDYAVQQFVESKEYESFCIPHLELIKATQSYVLMTVLNTDTKHGAHWILGCIFFTLKKIVLFDPAFKKTKNYYALFFQNLFSVVH